MPERPYPLSTFARSATGVALMIVAAKCFGFVHKLVLADRAGAGSEVDAYFTAFGVAFFLFVLVDDIVVPSFLPCFVALRERDPATAAALLRRTLGAVGSMLVLVAGAAWMWTEGVVSVVAPGFEGEQVDLAVSLVRWTLPGGVFLGIAGITYVVLNARHSFLLPATAAAAWKGAALVLLVALSPLYGVRGAAMALTGGAAVQLLLHLRPLWQELRPLGETSADALGASTRRMLWLMAPLAVGTLAAQSSGFVDNAVASSLDEGSISAVAFARKVVDVPVLMLPHVLGIVTFPTLIRLASQKAWPELEHLLGTLLGTCVVLLFPGVLVFVIAPDAVVTLLFRRGAFDAEAATQTALVFAWLSSGLIAYAAEILVLRVFYSLQDTFTPIVVGLVFAGLNVALTLALAPRLGIVALPLALVTQKSGKVVVLLALLTQRLGSGWIRSSWTAIRISGPALLAFSVVFLVGHFAIGHLGASVLLNLVVAVGAGLIYLALLAPTGLHRMLRA